MKQPSRTHIQKTLWQRFSETSRHSINSKGYVVSPEENILSGVNLASFEADLEAGSGNELHTKFLAVHSSSALAVNVFAPFRNNPSEVSLCGQSGFNSLAFEKQCPTGLGGTPPNLDLLIENDEYIIGVESKFLEYFSAKKPKFVARYCKENLPQAEDCWMNLLEDLRGSNEQFLDTAQLVKHYLGLRNQQEYRNRKIILLYIFWEPLSWQEVEICHMHRQQIADFADRVTGSDVQFAWQSYSELWDEWDEQGVAPKHVQSLRERYEVKI